MADASAPVIAARGVIKRYSAKAVLDGVDLVVPRGSVYGLLGRNGAGKTTLLKCLLGLIRSWEGEISVHGENPRDFSGDAKEKIGYVPQQPSLYPWMRVGKLVAYTGSFYPRWNVALVE